MRRRAAGALLALALAACGTRTRTPEAAPPRPIPEAVPESGSDKNLVLEEDDAGVMTPTFHKDWRWGAYVDKQGVSHVGRHSHDPATGNAR